MANMDCPQQAQVLSSLADASCPRLWTRCWSWGPGPKDWSGASSCGRRAGRFCAWILCLLLSGTAFAFQEGDEASLQAIRNQSSADLQGRILLERDGIDLRVLDVLGERADEPALDALLAARSLFLFRAPREHLYSALVHFKDRPGLRERVLEHISSREVDFHLRERVECLLAFGEDAHPALFEVLKDSLDPSSRGLALGGLLMTLVERGDTDALRLIIQNYREPDSGNRALGVSSMASFDDPQSIKVMRKFLHQEIPTASKTLILDALAELPLPDVERWLLDALRSKAADLRLCALQALARRGHFGHQNAIRRLERDKDPRLRRIAWLEQWRIATDRKAFEILALEKVRSRDWATRVGITNVLGQMSSDAVHAKLLELLQDPHFAVRMEAVRSLAKLRRKASIPSLITFLGRDRLRVQAEIHQALVTLTGLDHGPKPTRWQAWWHAEGEAFEVPSLDKAREAQLARLERSRQSQTQAAFYGIPLNSDHICFVLDVSRSMNEPAYSGRTRLTAVKRELRRTLEELPEGYLFNLIFFEAKLRSWKKKLTPMTPTLRKAALGFVERQKADGATALFDAVAKALADEQVDTIVILSDGEPSAGKFVDPEAILTELTRLGSVRQVRIHAITFHSGQTLLRDLSASTGGEYLEVR